MSREWSRRSAVSGVITLGTPHRGAPALPNFGQWAGFQASVSPLLNHVLSTFRRSSWDWVLNYAVNALNWMSDFSIWSVFRLAPAIGRRFPLADFAAAMAWAHGGRGLGKTVLEIG